MFGVYVQVKMFFLHVAFCREQHSRYRMEELIFNLDSSNVFFFSKHVLSGFKHLKLLITISALLKISTYLTISILFLLTSVSSVFLLSY